MWKVSCSSTKSSRGTLDVSQHLFLKHEFKRIHKKKKYLSAALRDLMTEVVKLFILASTNLMGGWVVVVVAVW